MLPQLAKLNRTASFGYNLDPLFQAQLMEDRMGARQPTDMSEMFGTHFNRRDKAALLALYADTALLTIDGTAVARGKAEIDRMLTPMFEGPLKMAIKCASCHEQGDTALVRSDWKLTGPDGAVAMAGSSAEVVLQGGRRPVALHSRRCDIRQSAFDDLDGSEFRRGCCRGMLIAGPDQPRESCLDRKERPDLARGRRHGQLD